MRRAHSSMQPMLATTALLALAIPCSSFIYELNDTLQDRDRFTYSEGWMFGSHDGPPLASKGPSYVHADIEVSALTWTTQSTSLNVSVMFYGSDAQALQEDNLNICASEPAVPDYFEDVEVYTFFAVKTGEGDNQRYVADVLAHRAVQKAGLQYSFFQVCPTDVGVDHLTVQGELAFRNPYGYLPGTDYGCIPFEIFRVTASVALGVFFGFVMWRHRLTVLRVHYMIFGVLVLSALEALSWLMAYRYVNRTGKPYCCPYPLTVVLAMVMEVLRRTTSRFLLLMICLGYGITRVSLEKRELVAVIFLTMLFLVTGITQWASSVATAADTGNPFRQGDPILAVPALLTDMIFLSWIYGTLVNMMKELEELNETYKLKMYQALVWTLGTFVGLFTALAAVMLAAEGSNEQSWQWKWEWIQVVSWEVFNFSMLAAVSIIWRPTEHSSMLAYSKQLATTEVAAEEAEAVEIDGIELQGPGGNHFTIDDEDDDSDGERDATNASVRDEPGIKSNRISTAVYDLSSFKPQRHMDPT